MAGVLVYEGRLWHCHGNYGYVWHVKGNYSIGETLPYPRPCSPWLRILNYVYSWQLSSPVRYLRHSTVTSLVFPPWDSCWRRYSSIPIFTGVSPSVVSKNSDAP